MNIASALLRQVLTLGDFETWSVTHKHYLPSEYHSLYQVIDKHCSTFHKLPTIDDLKLEIRDSGTRDKLYAVEAVKVDSAPYMLLEYLKNEYTQKQILDSLEDFVDNSVSFENAQESVDHLHQIVLDIEKKVDLEDPQESMQRIYLFEPEEDIAKYIPLGLNAEYDRVTQFSPRDLVMIGGSEELVSQLYVQTLLTMLSLLVNLLCISLLRWIAEISYSAVVQSPLMFLSHDSVLRILV